MRHVIKAAAILAISMMLTACSFEPATPPLPALSSKNVTPSLATLTEVNVLTGDDVPLLAAVELSGKRKDKIVLRIEQSLDGEIWTTVKEVTARGPKVELAASVAADAIGTPQFRATVATASKKPKVLVSSGAQTATVADINQLVRTFYYDSTQAYVTSTEAGLKFDEENVYPAFLDAKAKGWLSFKASSLEGKRGMSTVPALTTISPDPTWVPQAGPCNAKMKTPPAGRTFVVSVDSSDTWNGYKEASKADVHVTFLDGRLYNYLGC